MNNVFEIESKIPFLGGGVSFGVFLFIFYLVTIFTCYPTPTPSKLLGFYQCSKEIPHFLFVRNFSLNLASWRIT